MFYYLNQRWWWWVENMETWGLFWSKIEGRTRVSTKKQIVEIWGMFQYEIEERTQNIGVDQREKRMEYSQWKLFMIVWTMKVFGSGDGVGVCCSSNWKRLFWVVFELLIWWERRKAGQWWKTQRRGEDYKACVDCRGQW